MFFMIKAKPYSEGGGGSFKLGMIIHYKPEGLGLEW